MDDFKNRIEKGFKQFKGDMNLRELILRSKGNSIKMAKGAEERASIMNNLAENTQEMTIIAA